MFGELRVKAIFNERTGYGIHASRFFPELDALMRNVKNGKGAVTITLDDTVTASQRTDFPAAPSILYNVWESTEQPQEFMNNLRNYDQLWVASEWQRACSIAQGVPEEFVKVVPEGVDPNIYKPLEEDLVPSRLPRKAPMPFNFLHVGQWQPRKSTLEVIKAFQEAFPLDAVGYDNSNFRLYLSVDTLFPSDQYKTTEERLAAYGIEDPRIIVVHFEEREDYIRRLQQAQCFVTCARSEGWNLPLIEAMACGVVSIACDFGGSTEYAMDAVKVRVAKLIKPFGIYGNWEVPGQWCEPDFEHLVKQMRDVYSRYEKHKERALQTSDFIREKFSWKAAAEKAYKHLEELSEKIESSSLPAVKITHHGPPTPTAAVEDSPEKKIISYAKKLGYEIESLHKRKVIFTIDCHPSSMERVETLVESVRQVKRLGYPVLVTSHLPLPQPAIEEADFYIYDKRDILSGDDLPVYSRVVGEGKIERKQATVQCHALAWLHNMRNAIDFCIGKYDWIYNMSSDAECDLQEWVDKVLASDKDLIATKWEGADETFNGQLIAGKVEMFDKLYPRLETWEEFKEMFAEWRFCCERGYYKRAEKLIGLDNIDFIDVGPIGNRFDQVDRGVWPDEVFLCNFIDGPNLTISGISNREYDVRYTTPDGSAMFKTMQKPGMVSRAAIKYYKDWTITAYLNGELKFQHHMDLTGKRVLISLGSKALGDTIAWMPYIEEFRKKHKCHVVTSGWWQEIFDYPELEYVKPGDQVPDVYATYQVGCFDEQLHLNVQDWRLTPLQKVAADILGLDYEPIRAKLKFTPHRAGNGSIPGNYVCFSEFSTMRNKLWNRPGAWQELINFLNDKNYKCVSISNEESQLTGVIKHNNQSIQNSIADIAGAEFYIGLNAGPSWIAYALGLPVVMITGVSEVWNDFPNPYRIAINNEVCGIGCFNDPTHKIDRGWEWCPRNKDYVCTKNITPEMVMSTVEKLLEDRGLLEDLNHAIKKGNKREGNKRKHQRVDVFGKAAETGGGDSIVQRG